MNILTFDIEDWFHIHFDDGFNDPGNLRTFESRLPQNMDRILNELDRHSQKATFFCLGWVAREYPRVISMIDEAGHEIGSHSDNHELAFKFTPDEFRIDLKQSMSDLSEITGKPIRTYRAPAFSIGEKNKWAFDILVEEGIEIDCSVFPAKRDFGGFEQFASGVPRIIKTSNGSLLKELPINLEQIFGQKLIFSGGGYFRLFPYWMLRNLFKKSEYTMTYFHPRDFDANQPMLDVLSLSRKFKSYYGLKGAWGKFQKMLNDFDFIDVNDAVEFIRWDEIEQVSL